MTNEQNKRWVTISEYVDIETGELITKSKYEREYYMIKKTKKVTENDKYRIITFTNECRPKGQTKLW